MHELREMRLGLVYVTAAAITWSTAGFFTRLIGLDYPTMIAGRGIFGAVGLLVIIVLNEKGKTLRIFTSMRWPSFLYVLMVLFGMIAFVGSLGLTSVAHNAVIFATLPLISGFLGWLILKERPEGSAVVAAAIALAGVAIMVGLGKDGGFSGDLLSLLATLLMALSIIVIRRHREISVTAAACLGSFCSGLVCLPFADIPSIGPNQLVYLAAFGLLNSAAGLTLFSLGSRRLPAIQTALLSTLDTPLSPLWVWLFFSEAMSASTLLGGAIVLIAVVGNIVLAARKRRPVAAPV